MKVSIVMCTFNGEQYIKEQLDSIRLQTRTVDEVLICDDGSSDNTPFIVCSYIKKYELQECWHFSVNEKNKGYADNFHDVMMEATGDLVFLSDQDDIWHIDKVEKISAAFNEYNDMLLLCTGKHDFKSLDSISNNKENFLLENTESCLPNNLFCKKINISDKMMYLRASGCVMALKRKALNSFENYWFSGWAHDEYLWKMSLCFDGVYWSDEILMERRIHQSNVSLKKTHDYDGRVQYIRNLKKSYEAMLLCLKDQTTSSQNDEWQKLVLKHIESSKLRLDLVEKRKLWNAITLLIRYRNTLYNIKNIPVELSLALKQK